MAHLTLCWPTLTHTHTINCQSHQTCTVIGIGAAGHPNSKCCQSHNRKQCTVSHHSNRVVNHPNSVRYRPPQSGAPSATITVVPLATTTWRLSATPRAAASHHIICAVRRPQLEAMSVTPKRCTVSHLALVQFATPTRRRQSPQCGAPSVISHLFSPRDTGEGGGRRTVGVRCATTGVVHS